MDKLQQEVVPILILCAVIAFVVSRLPRVDLGHTRAFRRRRVANWLPLGLTYAFLYMGRYNLVGLLTAKLITGKEFGEIDAVGSLVYGVAFLLNGPLCDRWGGRTTILISASGAAVCNAVIGLMINATGAPPSFHTLMGLFALNMYFQSFGAVSIVKVNAAWFHLRERGTFGGIFGILISLGLYLAFDWAPNIAAMTSLAWLFLAPAVILVVFFVLSFLFVRNSPAEAGLADFDVADASSGETGPPDPALVIIKRMLTSKIILIISLISLCSGFLRQGILKWYRTFADAVHIKDTFVYAHWGMVSCIAGITGGIFAGVVSDQLFKSRRPPVSTVLFTLLLAGSVAIVPLLATPAAVSWVIAGMAVAVIGVHGMLSGVASQDFGGRRNAGTATGMIDGFVYLGTALQGFVYGNVLPEAKITVNGQAVVNPDYSDLGHWHAWPLAMIPVAVVGLALSISIWNARVKPNTATAAPVLPDAKAPPAAALPTATLHQEKT
ncbi:MAG TPA: MFS transporter [Kofleriaceae bacterium]|nr:MFS transporter [Kofleriaceae bacterium]